MTHAQEAALFGANVAVTWMRRLDGLPADRSYDAPSVSYTHLTLPTKA